MLRKRLELLEPEVEGKTPGQAKFQRVSGCWLGQQQGSKQASLKRSSQRPLLKEREGGRKEKKKKEFQNKPLWGKQKTWGLLPCTLTRCKELLKPVKTHPGEEVSEGDLNLYFFFLILDRLLLCSPGCLWTHYADQVSFKLTCSCLSLPRSPGIKSRRHHSWLGFMSKWQSHRLLGSKVCQATLK